MNIKYHIALNPISELLKLEPKYFTIKSHRAAIMPTNTLIIQKSFLFLSQAHEDVTAKCSTLRLKRSSEPQFRHVDKSVQQSDFFSTNYVL